MKKLSQLHRFPHDHTMIGQKKLPMRWTPLLWQRQYAAKHICDDFPDFLASSQICRVEITRLVIWSQAVVQAYNK